jgi:hypothetical protein
MAQQGNPFYVKPMGDYGASIVQGIGNIAGGLAEQQKAEQLQQAQAAQQQEMQAAFASGDPNQVSGLILKYPNMRETITAAVGHRDESTKANMASTIRASLANPDKAPQIIQARIDALQATYGPDTDLDDSLQAALEAKESPETFLNNLEMLAPAYLDEQEWKAYSEKRNPEKKETTLMQNLQAAGLKPGTPEYQKAVLAYIKKPAGTTINMGDAKTMEKATEGQLAASGFANRVQAATSTLTSLEESGYDPTSLTEKIATVVPGGNYALSNEAQEYQGAKEDFITAVLRKESGAVISDQEFAREDKKYFPQPGDSAKTVQLKQARRDNQLEVLRKQSKGVYEIQYSQGGSSEAPPAALKFLLANPQFADQFKQKYGYLPEGM